MAEYLVYWRSDTVRDPQRGAVNYVASDQLRRAGVVEGDVLWPVTCPARGSLVVVGRVAVRALTDSRAEAERLLGRQGLWDAETYAVDPTAPQVAPWEATGFAADLRFDGTPDRLPLGFTGQQLQSMRRLAEESAERLTGAWNAQLRPAALPLSLHERYGRREAFAAVGVDYTSQQQHLNTGLSPRNPDGGYCIFITVDKEEMDAAYNYEDELYEDRFRWITRRGRGEAHQDYVTLRQDGTRVSLFVRAAPSDRFVYLGEMRYGKHREFSTPKGLQQEYLFTLDHRVPDVLLSELSSHVSTAPERPAQRGAASARRRSASIGDFKNAFSYVLDRLDRVVVPAHHNYQVQLKAWLEARGVAAEWERDFIDVQFVLGDAQHIGEIKVTGYLRAEEAFRAALGQLLVYGRLKFQQPPQMLMLLDHRPIEPLLELASSLGISVVAKSADRFELLTTDVDRTALTALFD
jgi:hypothetical protein